MYILQDIPSHGFLNGQFPFRISDVTFVVVHFRRPYVTRDIHAIGQIPKVYGRSRHHGRPQRRTLSHWGFDYFDAPQIRL